MTINKAQWQSINTILRPVFSHGQLYVALSKAGLPHRTKVMLIDVKDTQGPIQDNNGKYTSDEADAPKMIIRAFNRNVKSY